MYAAAYRTDPQLAAQNNGESWIDCTLRRRRPRPHRFILEHSISTGGRRWYRCTRCPVSTVRTDANYPAPYLGGRNR